MQDRRSRFQAFTVCIAVLLAGALLAACGGDDDDDGGGGSSGGSGKIALLLPETKTTRYEEQDKPNFERRVKELCSGCEVIYANANQDPAKQQQQAEAAITKGAKVIVIRAVDVASAASIVERAKQSDVTGRATSTALITITFAPFVIDRPIQGRPATGAGADGRDQERREEQPQSRNDQRCADGLELEALQGRRGPGAQEGGRRHRQELRHARLEPGQGPAGDGADDHFARERRLRRRLRGQRRHGGRRDCGAQGRADRSLVPLRDGPGRGARRSPADPRGRAVDDRLPANHRHRGDGGRAGRADRAGEGTTRRPRQGQGRQRRQASALGAARHDRDPAEQHREHPRQAGIPRHWRDLQRQVRPVLQGGRRPVTSAALAVDAGQTEIRAALTGERGPRTATAPGVLRLGGLTGPDQVAAGLLAAVAGLGALPQPLPPAGIGLSGFEAASEEDLRRVHELLRRELGLQRVAIASDGLTSLLGALGDRPGAVVAAGTGAVCVARDGERMAKVDGWGSLLGDAGSGFAVGRAGLDAALRHLDGRGGSAVLLKAAERRFGTAAELAERIHGAPVPTRAVASFAADVAREAEAGDELATAILRDAGRALALSACAALA